MRSLRLFGRAKETRDELKDLPPLVIKGYKERSGLIITIIVFCNYVYFFILQRTCINRGQIDILDALILHIFEN